VPLVITCPSEEDLLGFHLGTLSDPALDSVAEHLEACFRCQTRVQKLDDTHDPVVTLLRHGDMPRTATFKPNDPPLPPSLLDPPQEAEELGRLGHYRVLRLIGWGGMGFVFEAEDVKLGRRVALKAIKPSLAEDAAARQRFIREARTMAGIRRNDHLVTIFEVDEERRVPYLAMELLEGESLDRRIARGGRAAAADVIRLGREAALGLAAIHDHGLVHRDVKPGNLWVEAGTGHVKVLDFGLVRTITGDMRVTQSDVIAGTPAYLSPEQARGDTVDARGDLFSLGCVLYELCAGRPPFTGKNTLALVTALASTDPIPLRNLRPDLPRPLTDLVMQLLAKNPARRPPSARVVAERLEAMAASRPSRRKKTPVWLAAALVAAVGLLLGVYVVRVETSKGVVEITAEAGVKVVVEQNGEFVTILDPESKQKVELRAGEYQVKLVNDGPGLILNTDRFTLHRGDKTIVTVRRIEPPVKARDDPWSQYVAKLPPAEQVKAVTARLRELNPEFKTPVTHEVEDGIVRALHFRTDHVVDISPVRALNGLQRLSCPGEAEDARVLKDLSPLKGLKLTKLDCSNSAVADLTPLREMTTLTELWCEHTEVTDLAPLKGLPLEKLQCGGTHVDTLIALAGMKKLTELGFWGTKVNTLEPLKDLPLTWLNCAHCGIAELSPLEGQKLVTLFCDDNRRLSSLAPLRGMPLKHLNCGSTAVTDLAPLEGMRLEFLNCGDTKVTDLRPLRGMRLTKLWCDRSGVDDLAPLRGMDSLHELVCYKTKVTSLAPLEGLPLVVLNFGITSVDDLTPLKGMKLDLLGCGQTEVANLLPVQGMPLTTVWCNDSKVSSLEPLRGMKLTVLLCNRTNVKSLAPIEGMPLKELGWDVRPGKDADIVRAIKTLETINGKRPNDLWTEADKKQ
jgi:Leucine-rich repeat (LRR) protein